MRSIVAVGLGFCLLTLPRAASAAPGDLDATFGGTGVVTTAVTAGFDAAWSTLVQPDGKIVAAGQARDTTTDFAVVRYEADGTLDAGFGTGGVVVTPIGAADEIARAIVRQPDGKLLVAGYARIGSNNDFAVVRYDSTGALDATFGTGGIVTTPIGSSNDNAFAMALQSDGKIILAGYAIVGGTLDFALVRYETDGTLDTTFDGDGIVTAPVGPSTDLANAVAVQADGKIVAAGYTSNAGVFEIAVLRFDADGSLDATFDGDGIAVTSVGPSGYAIGTSLATQADGRITVAGYSNNGTDNDFAVVRFEADGSLDVTFDGDGKALIPIGSADDQGRALLRQPDGKLVVAGLSHNGSNFDVAVLKLEADGSPDAAFGTVGAVTTDINDADGTVAVALQADGRVVAAGFSGPTSTPDTTVVRYENALCGDGIVDAGEQCDDGNAEDGDCCDSRCQYDPISTPCGDGDACNGSETCDGAGVCESGTAPDCDDGDACTQDSCDPIDGCQNPAEPATGCLDTWAKASLLVKETSPGKEALSAKLKNGPALTAADFGDPLTGGGTAYTVCLYGDGGLAARLEVDRAGQSCAGKDCWKALGSRGYRYKDKDASADGMSKMKLLAGGAGKSKVQFKAGNNAAKGQNSLPTGTAAALAGSTSATLQIHGSDAPACLSTTLSTVVKDTGSYFKAK